MIIKQRVSLEEILKNGNRDYHDRGKFCIDRSRSVVAID